MEDRVNILVAELLATCALVHHGGSSVHSSEVKLFHGLNELHNCVQELEREELKKVQATIEKALKEMVFMSRLSLSPSFYSLLGNLWTTLFSRGDSRNVMAIGNDFIDNVSSKSNLSLQGKAAAFHCLGAIYCSSHGKFLSGHLREAVSVVYKLFKTISLTNTRSVGENELRFAAVKAIAQGAQASGSAGQGAHPEMLKLLVKASTDKSPAVREVAAEGVMVLAMVSNSFSSVPLDALVNICVKAFDDSVLCVRLAFARSLGAILSLSVEHSNAIERQQGSASAGDGGREGMEDTPSPNASGQSQSSSSTTGSSSKFAQMAQKSAAAMRKAGGGFGLASPSSRLKGFGFGSSFPSLTVRSKASEGPVSYTLQSALDMLLEGFDNWTYEMVLKRSDSQQSQDKQGLRLRSHETRLAFVEAAVEFLRIIQQNSDSLGKEMMQQHALKFAVGLCDESKRDLLATDLDRDHDSAFRRNVTVYFLGSAVSSHLDESGKLELACALINACTHTESSRSNGSGEVRAKPFNFKRRTSRASSTGSVPGSPTANMRPTFRYNSTFLAAMLMELSSLLSTLGDAALALSQELDFQLLLPLLEHENAVVRQEIANLLYVCAVSLPGYAANGVLPLLQLIGLYQAEVTVSFGSLGGGLTSSSSSSSSSQTDVQADRTLKSISGLVGGLCAFILSATANGRPKSSTADQFLRKENVHLPTSVHASVGCHLGMQHQQKSASVPAGSNSLLSGDLKSISPNITMALLGFAKSMISRQHDGSMTPNATAQVSSAGWALIAALVSLGPSWCLENVNQLFQAWQGSVEAALPALVQFSSLAAANTAAASKAKELEDISADTVASLVCLKASMQALYSFVRCNQLLLQDMPTLSRAIATIVEQVVQVTVTRPVAMEKSFARVFMGLHAALFSIVSWLPRHELRIFKAAFVDKLHALAVNYIMDTSYQTEEPHSLFRSSGILSDLDNVLETAIPEIDAAGSVAFVAPSCLWKFNWSFELTKPPSLRFTMLMNAKVLTPDEARDSALQTMMQSSCNAARERVAISPNQPVVSGDHLVCVGMTLPPDPRIPVRCMDAAITFSAVALGQVLPSATRDAVLQQFVNDLKSTHGAAQALVLRKVLATLVSLARHLANTRSSNFGSNKKHQWLSRAKGILCVALSSPIAEVRRAASLGLAFFTRAAGPGFGYSVINSLHKKFDQNTANDSGASSNGTGSNSNSSTANGGDVADPSSSTNTVSPFFKAGFVLCQAMIRRECMDQDTRYVKNNIVYDSCKLTSQPIRTWALHAWQTIVDAVGVDVNKFVKPSLALINAHILASDGHPTRGSYGAMLAHVGTYVSLARLTNGLVGGLGPELCREDVESQRFLNIWDCLRQASDHPRLQLECVKMIQLILLFQPSLIMSQASTKAKIQSYLQTQVLRLEYDDGSELRSAALNAFFSFVEKDRERVNIEETVAWGSLAFGAYELAYRSAPCQDWVIPPLSSTGYGAFLLRSSQSARYSISKHDALRIRQASLQNPSLDEFAQLQWPLCDLQAFRTICMDTTTKLIGLCQRELRNQEEDDEVKVYVPTEPELASLMCLTKWIRQFRAVMSGTVEQFQREEMTRQGQLDPKLSSNDAEEEDSEDDQDGGAGGGLNSHDTGATQAQLEESALRQLEQFLNRILGKCCGETKILAVEGMLEVLSICSQVRVHRDLVFAQQVLKKLGKPEEGQFICMHMQELLSGASQAANGQIQGAEMPQVSILGYISLLQIVRMFASSSDPHSPSQSLLKQYEMQLAATLGPGLGPTASPLVLQFAVVFALELLVSGTTSSASRIVNLLLPSSLRSSQEEDDSDDEEFGAGGSESINALIYQNQPCIALEIDLVRCTALAKLFLHVHGVNTSSAQGREMAWSAGDIEKMSKSEKKRKKNLAAVKAALEKALANVLGTKVSSGKSLLGLWKTAVLDLSVMLCPTGPGMRLCKDSTCLTQVQDALLLFPAYVNSFPFLVLALALMVDEISVEERKTALVSSTQFLLEAMGHLPMSSVRCLFVVIEKLLISSGGESVGSGCYWSILQLLKQFFSRVQKIKGRGRVGGISILDDALRAAFAVLTAMVRSPECQAAILSTESDAEYVLWHKVVETVVVPLQESLGRKSLQSVLHTGAESTAGQERSSTTLLTKAQERIEMGSLRVLLDVIKACPEACREGYLPGLVSLLVGAMNCSAFLETVRTASKVLMTTLPLFPERIVACVFSEALRGAGHLVQTTGNGTGTLWAKKLVCFLQVGWCCLSLEEGLRAGDARVKSFVDLLEECMKDGEHRKTIASLTFLLALARSDDQSTFGKKRNIVFARVGPRVAELLRAPDETVDWEEFSSVPQGAAKVLCQLTKTTPNLLQFVIIALLSMAEGSRTGARSAETQSVARGCLVELVTTQQDQVKGVVQSIPPHAAQALQGAIRTHLAQQSG